MDKLSNKIAELEEDLRLKLRNSLLLSVLAFLTATLGKGSVDFLKTKKELSKLVSGIFNDRYATVTDFIQTESELILEELGYKMTKEYQDFIDLQIDIFNDFIGVSAESLVSKIGITVSSMKSNNTANASILFLIREIIKGASFNRYAFDLLSNSIRSFISLIANNNNLTSWDYIGAYDERNRPFCSSKVGKSFSKSQIEAWVSQEWTGKRVGTNKKTIFSYVGGVGCRHILKPKAQ